MTSDFFIGLKVAEKLAFSVASLTTLPEIRCFRQIPEPSHPGLLTKARFPDDLSAKIPCSCGNVNKTIDFRGLLLTKSPRPGNLSAKNELFGQFVNKTRSDGLPTKPAGFDHPANKARQAVLSDLFNPYINHCYSYLACGLNPIPFTPLKFYSFGHSGRDISNLKFVFRILNINEPNVCVLSSGYPNSTQNRLYFFRLKISQSKSMGTSILKKESCSNYNENYSNYYR